MLNDESFINIDATFNSDNVDYRPYSSFSQLSNTTLKVKNAYSEYAFDNLTQIENNLNNILFSSTIESDLLPPGVRHISPGFVVFERPPSMQLVQYINNSVEQISSDGDEIWNEDDESYDIVEIEPISTYYIPVPWQLYFAFYSMTPGSQYYVTSVKMFFMNSPLNSHHNQLFMPYIPNFFTNGSLCNPMLDTYEEIDRYPKNISGIVQSAYDWVWNTGFNADLYECVSQIYEQKPNQFVIDSIKNTSSFSNHYSNNVVNHFYRNISKLSLEDVTNMKWANPSYGTHFQYDRNLIEKSYFDNDYLFSYYLTELQYPETSQASLETHKDQFRNWLTQNPHYLTKHPKDYISVIKYIVDNESSFKDTFNPAPHLNSYQSFLNKLVNIH